MTKLETAEHYSWYIINALMGKVRDLDKAIEDAEETLRKKPDDDNNSVYASLEGMLAHCKQSRKEHKQALDALKAAGFK